MFEMFPTKNIGIILDLNVRMGWDKKSCLVNVQEVLLKYLNKLETDDQVYVYSEFGELEPHRWLGEAIAAVANYQLTKFDLNLAVQESIFLLQQCDNCSRNLYVFTNRYQKDSILTESFEIDTRNEVSISFFALDPVSHANLSSQHPSRKIHNCMTAKLLDELFYNDFADLLVPR